MSDPVDGNSIPNCQGPNPDPGTPIHVTPAGAWDCHAHIFGPVEQYPFTPKRSYTPPEANLAAYRRMLAALGIAHAVIVQPSVYGTDNRCTYDTVVAAAGAWRGVAVVSPSVNEHELERLHAAGFRGVRVNVLFMGGGLTFEELERLALRVAPLGWHVQLLLDGRDLVELAPRLRRLPVPIVVDHMGHMPASVGIAHAGFQTLLQLVRDGRCWVKLSGAYRISAEPYPYPDVVPFARALIEADASRMVWGSDWPHPAVSVPIPKDAEVLDLLAAWAPDAEVRRRILSENPARLYGLSNDVSRMNPIHH